MKPLSGRVKRTAGMAAGAILAAGATTGFIVHHAHSSTVTDQDGVTVTYTGDDRVGSTNDGMKYAPRPTNEFRAQRCDLSPQQAPAASPDQLALPAAGIEAPVGPGADLAALPPAPQTTWFTGSAPVGADHGKTLIAGHVDHADGKLSPFGQLHTAAPCEHIFLSDTHGQQHEYVLTDMYTVPQDQIETVGIYTRTGDPALVLVTCSGPSVADAHGDGQAAYHYNLILEAVPVEVPA